LQKLQNHFDSIFNNTDDRYEFKKNSRNVLLFLLYIPFDFYGVKSKLLWKKSFFCL